MRQKHDLNPAAYKMEEPWIGLVCMLLFWIIGLPLLWHLFLIL